MSDDRRDDRRSRFSLWIGWAAVLISTAITGLWAFWGINETFHEGWFYSSFRLNIGMTFVQYLSPAILFLAATLAAIRLPRAGAILHIVLGLFAWWFFGFMRAASLLIMLPMGALGALYWFGRPQPRRLAMLGVVVVTSLILAGFAVEPIWRISGRLDDGNRGARVVQGNGVSLMWAPEGPGWPRESTGWEESAALCDHLMDDGVTLASTPRNIWRLPTVDEAVRSMARHGVNCGGVWDPAGSRATYKVRPDKESPLWDIHSPVIYWWTATESGANSAYSITYNGLVVVRTKKSRYGSLAFRCVRDAWK